MKKNMICSAIALTVSAATAYGAESVKTGNAEDLALSIYNNRALVRDVRRVNLPAGKSSVLFSGVAGKIQPESIIINADGVMLKEQNYNFAMLSPENVAKANVGKTVKTVLWDDEKGQNIYNQAELLDVYAGQPVLRFDYGIEFNFPGRIIWTELPDNLQTKPSLSLGLETVVAGEKKLDLMYLTGGLQWSANYVAEFAGDSELNLKSWVSINNTSGIDYNNARIQLVAGDANTVYQSINRPMVMMMKSMSNARGVDMAAEAVMPSEESVGEYHVYSLPEKITLMDDQTKQVSLLSKDKIKYEKEYRIVSPLYLSVRNNSDDFKKVNADTYIKLKNIPEANLGEPLPQGVMRFYDHDSKGNMLFVGEANFKQLAVGEDTELRIGRSFDISATGKVASTNKIAEQTSETEVSIVLKNAKSSAVKVVFEQYLHDDWSIISENIKSEKHDAHTLRWTIEVPSQGSAVLNFKVRINKING